MLNLQYRRVLRHGIVGLLMGGCSESPGLRSGQDLSELPVLEFTETAVIGGFRAEGVHALGFVRSATLIPGSDQLAVADGSSQRIHYFTRSGDHVRSIGRRGGGPGESQALRKVWGRPDGGLCTWDVQQIRVTQFDAIGDVVATGRADLDEMESIRPSFVGFLDDCSFVLRDRRDVMALKSAPEGMRLDTLRFVLFSPAGSLLDEVATVQGAEKWFRNRDGGWGLVDPILGDELVGFVSANRLWFGLSDTLQWTRIHLRRGGIDTLRIPVAARFASLEDIEAERQRRLDAVEVSQRITQLRLPVEIDGASLADTMAEGRRAGLRVVVARDHFPAYDQAVAGSGGIVWVREFPRPEEQEATWVMVSGDGTLAGRFIISRDAEILSASPGWLLLLEEDELDASVVRVLRRVGPD